MALAHPCTVIEMLTDVWAGRGINGVSDMGVDVLTGVVILASGIAGGMFHWPADRFQLKRLADYVQPAFIGKRSPGPPGGSRGGSLREII